MKKYQTPEMEAIIFQTEDIVTASGVIGIVSAEHQAGAAETQETSWNENWN